MPKFYKGQKVVCMSDEYITVTKGGTYTVVDVNDRSGALLLTNDICVNVCVAASDFEPVPTFTKADLKDGMVITVRDGRKAVVHDDALHHVAGSVFTGRRLIEVHKYLEDLTSSSGLRQYDAMEVSYMGEVLWVREEESERDKKLKALSEEAAKAQQAVDAIQKQIKELENE